MRESGCPVLAPSHALRPFHPGPGPGPGPGPCPAAGAAGDGLWLCASPDNQPSSLAGIVDLAIGSSFQTLWILNLSLIPPKGWHEVAYQTGGALPAGLTVHVQAAVFTAASGYALPGGATKVQVGTVLL